MSKERAAALAAITEKLLKDDLPGDEAASRALLVLVGDGLKSLDRIATALEKIAAPPAAMQGEAILSAPPSFTAEQIDGIVTALQKIADRPR
jgi:hypothetical protein